MKIKRRLAAILSAGLLLLAGSALADNVTFDFEPLGTNYGAPVGMVPGDFMFFEYGANLYINEFWIGGAPFFNVARIDPAMAIFGAGQILQVNNVGIRFNFTSAADVTFEYLDLGGSVNLQVNGFGVVLEAADMAGLVGPVAPGVTMNATVVPVSGGHRGTVTLTGPVATLQVGGQELWLDDVKCDNGYVPGTGPGGCDNEVTHQTLPVGAAWGAGFGSAPGDLIFVEDGIPVLIDVIDWGTGTGFNFCDVQVPGIPDFGFDRVMNLNNVSNVYEIGALGVAVQKVTFEFVDFGGTENLQVNGGPLHVGDLPAFPAAIAPGVTCIVNTWPIGGGGIRGEVELVGDVQLLRVAGQEFMIDDICIVEQSAAGDCDLVSDNESQVPGSAWGSAFGNVPGDIIFNEDGIDVGLEVFDAGGVILFNEARTDSPWGPLGSGNVLHLNNICATYDLAPFSPVSALTFDWVKGGGVENLGINGILYAGPIEAIPAGFFPGYAVTVTVNSGPGYTYGTVTVTGDVQRLQVGGQEFYIDELCVYLDDGSAVPDIVSWPVKLAPNVPNPFNPATMLHYSLAQAGHVRLSVHDLSGRCVATLVDGTRSAGDHRVMWDGRDDGGRRAASGMYLVMVESGGRRAVRKISMLK